MLCVPEGSNNDALLLSERWGTFCLTDGDVYCMQYGKKEKRKRSMPSNDDSKK